MNARIFHISECDGDETQEICDGQHHYSRVLSSVGTMRRSIRRNRSCDGLCKPENRTHDLRKLLAKAESDTLQESNGRILPTVVRLDEFMLALFVSDQSISGVKFASMYAKRNSQYDEYCIGIYHVHWSESFDWWGGSDSGTCATHTISAKPCDGSCKKTTKLTGSELQSLRKQERDRKIWEDEWNKKHGKPAV